MKKNNAIRRGRPCVFNMHVHLVFVIKYRRGVFTKDVLDDSQKDVSEPSQQTMGWRPLVAELLCRKLWRCAYRDRPTIHCATTDAKLIRRR